MKKKRNIIEWCIQYKQIVLLIAFASIIFGVYSLIVMPKQEFPTFTIRQGLVIGVYPGANSSQVEEQLTKPLERFLFTYKEVKKAKTYSESRDGVVYVYVQLNDDVNNKDEVWSKIKHGLNTFKSELPKGVLGLIANDDFGDTSALLITLESDTKTYHQLQTYLENLEDHLRRIESVSNLRHYGLQKEQISIYIQKEKIATYGINLLSLYKTLSSQGMAIPAGKVDNDALSVPIHIKPTHNTEKEIEDLIIFSDSRGNNIRLKDIASVVREYPKPDSYITNNGKKCLVLSTEMRSGFNIVKYGREVDAVLKEFEKTLPGDVSIYRIADQPQVVGSSIYTFLKELLIAVVAVLIVIVLLLPLRVAGVAASSIPITIFISLALMFACGIELNTVTLAGLIVVLGMIVDNSIVIVDSYLEKLDQGVPRLKASVDSTKEYFKAILSATLAISITFFPFLVTMKGQFLDFLQAFPWTILITLSVSLAVAVMIIPFLQYHFIRKGIAGPEKGRNPKRKSFLDILQENYNKLLDIVFKYPKTTIALTLVSVVTGLYMFANLPQRLMPIAERNQFAVEIYLPSGTSLDETKSVAGDLEKTLKKDKRVVSVTNFMGTGSPRFQTTYAPKMGGKNFAQFIVNTSSSQDTEDLLDEYTNSYAHHYPNAYVKFKQLDYQDAVSEIEIRLSGDSLQNLKREADKLMSELRTLKEPLRIWKNIEEPLPDVSIEVDQVEASRLGVNDLSVGLALSSRFGGFNIGNIWENDYSVPLVLKSQWENKDPNLDDIENEYVSGIMSPAVPLRQIAKVTPGWDEGQIVRRNGVRCITIMMDLKRGELANLVQKKIEKIVEKHQEDLGRNGIRVTYGGVAESDAENMPPIMGGLMISVVIIFFILIFHFKSIRLSSIIIASTMLCFFGAALGLRIMHLNFSITAVLGIVSLIGIIVRNGIIMFDYIKELRHEGKDVYEAAKEAGRRRMRPIFLTTAAASFGVIPMIISKSPLWCPMGTVIAFGAMITMVFILTVLPLVYWITYRKQDKQINQD